MQVSLLYAILLLLLVGGSDVTWAVCHRSEASPTNPDVVETFSNARGTSVGASQHWQAVGRPDDDTVELHMLQQGVWTFAGKVRRPTHSKFSEEFGHTLTLVEDDSVMRDAVLVVGAPAADDSRGAVYVFDLRHAGSVGAASFEFRQRIAVNSRQSTSAGARFGHTVSLLRDSPSGSGMDAVAVGAPGPNSAVYIFLRVVSHGTFALVQTHTAAADETHFGYTLAYDQESHKLYATAIVGSASVLHEMDASGVAPSSGGVRLDDNFFASSLAADKGVVAVGVMGNATHGVVHDEFIGVPTPVVQNVPVYNATANTTTIVQQTVTVNVPQRRTTMLVAIVLDGGLSSQRRLYVSPSLARHTMVNDSTVCLDGTTAPASALASDAATVPLVDAFYRPHVAIVQGMLAVSLARDPVWASASTPPANNSLLLLPGCSSALACVDASPRYALAPPTLSGLTESTLRAALATDETGGVQVRVSSGGRQSALHVLGLPVDGVAGSTAAAVYGACTGSCAGGAFREKRTQCVRYGGHGGVVCSDAVESDTCTAQLYTYEWIEAGNWGSCSATFCGSGRQVQTVECRRCDGVTVSTSLCNLSVRPSTSRHCDYYTYRWTTGNFENYCRASTSSSSILSCGTGQRWRTVGCVRCDGVSVSQSYCYTNAGSRPTEAHPCELWYYNWSTGPWTYCVRDSTGCGGSGTRDRTVGCDRCDGLRVDDNRCSGSKPDESESCSSNIYSWAWDRCRSSYLDNAAGYSRAMSCHECASSSNTPGDSVSDSYCTDRVARPTSSTQSCGYMTDHDGEGGLEIVSDSYTCFSVTRGVTYYDDHNLSGYLSSFENDEIDSVMLCGDYTLHGWQHGGQEGSKVSFVCKGLYPYECCCFNLAGWWKNTLSSVSYSGHDWSYS